MTFRPFQFSMGPWWQKVWQEENAPLRSVLVRWQTIKDSNLEFYDQEIDVRCLALKFQLSRSQKKILGRINIHLNGGRRITP